jgi:hypothetical protein
MWDLRPTDATGNKISTTLDCLPSNLTEHGTVTEEAISIPAYKRQYVSQDGIQWEGQTLQRMPSWDAVY